MRANVVVFEEAQSLDADVHDAVLPQVGKDAKFIYIGTSRYPSVLNDAYTRAAGILRTPWWEVLDAGIVDFETLREIYNAMRPVAWREYYGCEWVVSEDVVFQIPKVAPFDCPFSIGVGIDVNPGAGHAAVAVGTSPQGKLVVLKAYVSKRMEAVCQEIEKWSKAGTARVFIEDSDNPDAVGKQVEYYFAASSSVRTRMDPWNEKSKMEQVGRCVYMMEKGLLADAVGLPFHEVLFKGEKMVKKNHLVDAWIHAVAAVMA